jgi:hypothetical protein
LDLSTSSISAILDGEIPSGCPSRAFQPWSSLYHLADATYQDPARFEAVFNTELLARFFKQNKGIEGHIYNPSLNPQIAQHLSKVKKLKNVLIYYRTWAANLVFRHSESCIINIADPIGTATTLAQPAHFNRVVDFFLALILRNVAQGRRTVLPRQAGFGP